MPTEWKKGVIVAILKIKHSIQQSRKLTLLSGKGKHLEKIVRRRLLLVVEIASLEANWVSNFVNLPYTRGLLYKCVSGYRLMLDVQQKMLLQKSRFGMIFEAAYVESMEQIEH